MFVLASVQSIVFICLIIISKLFFTALPIQRCVCVCVCVCVLYGVCVVCVCVYVCVFVLYGVCVWLVLL